MLFFLIVVIILVIRGIYTGDGPPDISKRVDYLVEAKDLSGRYSGSSKSNFLLINWHYKI